jgi:hypothetical protein
MATTAWLGRSETGSTRLRSSRSRRRTSARRAIACSSRCDNALAGRAAGSRSRSASTSCSRSATARSSASRSTPKKRTRWRARGVSNSQIPAVLKTSGREASLAKAAVHAAADTVAPSAGLSPAGAVRGGPMDPRGTLRSPAVGGLMAGDRSSHAALVGADRDRRRIAARADRRGDCALLGPDRGRL